MFQRGKKNSESMRAATLGGLAALGVSGAGVLAYATSVEPDWIEVVQVPLRLPRLSERFHGYKIVQISDLHAGIWLPDARFERVVRMVNGEQPDLIAVTGDFVTSVYRGALADIAKPLSKLSAKDGAVAVLGNHDYWGRPGPMVIRRGIKESGIIDLNNKVHTVERDGATFHIAGVDSARARRAKLDLVLEKLPQDGAAMLLAHEPDFADVSAATGRFDLQISGHSHGGQVRVPFLDPPRLPPMGKKYHTGLYKVGEMLEYTNRGIGMVGLPIRFWCRPEITVFTLEGTRG